MIIKDDMDLILWRHADAQEDGLELSDLDRELTAKGRKQAMEMGKWLDARLAKDCRVLVSPAIRAQQTAAGLGRRFETVREIAPGVDPTAILVATGWPDAKGAVLVVGHQPTLGQVTAMLLFGESAPLTIKKGGLVWLTNRTRRGEQQVVLKAAMVPELV
jgi:phosphohistidine phosphatase